MLRFYAVTALIPPYVLFSCAGFLSNYFTFCSEPIFELVAVFIAAFLGVKSNSWR